MQIIENKALLFRTRNPAKYSIIPKHKVLEADDDGIHEVAVYWGLDEARVLHNLGVKNVPSPIVGRYQWPGRYKPMQHQIDTAAFLTMHRRAFCFNDPGTGKTMSALWAADYLIEKGYVRRVLVLCPLSIMQSAWMQDLNNAIMHRSAIVAHHTQSSRRIEMIQQDYTFVITNYDGLALVAPEIIRDGRFDLVIVDECFVAGTLVSTPQGKRPIEQLRAGDKVLTSDGVARIKRLVRNTAEHLVEVKLGNGKTIRCTPEHPFFTDVGWVCAKNLAGRRLISNAELSGLRTGVSPSTLQSDMGYGEQPPDWTDLLKILRTEEVASTESQQESLYKLSARATGQSYETEDGRAPKEIIGDSQNERAQTKSAGWERNRYDICGADCPHCIAKSVGMELPDSVGYEAARLSHELQARLRMAGNEIGFGSGRQQPHSESAKGARPQEGGEVGTTWVESVSYIKCDSLVDVFNLEVEGTPNYFVGDHWLVHNCNAYKNATTNRWKALASIIKPETYLWMMTGTPASQSPVDAYGLAKLVNPGGVPKYLSAWRDQTMHKITQFKWAPKPNAAELVFEALQPAIRFTKAQCLDLPPVITVTRDVPMTPQQSKYYRLLKEQMMVKAAGETISAVNAGVAVSKLLQISCGAAYTDDREVVEFDASPRLAVLEEVLQETKRKVLIFAMFRSSIDAVAAYLNKKGYPTEQIQGDVSPAKRTRIIHDFQNTDNVRVLVLQPAAAAHGLTLTAADTVIFYGPLMSVEMYTQCIARADRKGQDSDKVTVVHLQSSHIEREMFKAMNSKVSEHALLVNLFNEEIKS
jgi:superfamily II DNA or RNA helicase